MPVLGRVFQVEGAEEVMVVVPLGPAINFLYRDVHGESNGLMEEFELQGYRHVLIDLSRVDYVDSIIIGALIRLLQKARTSGGQAVFCCASENMQDVLKCIKIGTLWPHFAARDEAVEAIRAGNAAGT
jgi:anti-sigma B factor antagonist